MHQKIFLGFGCNGYRSFFGNEDSRFGPFDKIQVLAGQNNCGKSSLVDFVIKAMTSIDVRGEIARNHYPFTREDTPLPLKSAGANGPLTISLCIDRSVLLESSSLKRPSGDKWRAELSELFSRSPYISTNGDGVWLDFLTATPAVGSSLANGITASFSQFKSAGLSMDLNRCSSDLLQYDGDDESCYAAIIRSIVPWGNVPRFVKVDAIRSVEDDDLPDRDVDLCGGRGLPTALLRLFNPERSNHTRAEERLNKLQGFVRNVMNDPCTSLLVSHESHEISLKTSDADYLPLDSLGTGVTELIILASIIACNDNRIICIEEPEIHLHPALQARFMKYLLEDDSNRFIITTHSPTVINYPGVQVAHVSKANGVSRCKQLDGLGCARDLLDDLGVKASDLLQASFIVWVEGPSDRIYLTYWIKRWSDEHNISLEEGIHYSVLIYGGKLLNALDASTCGDVPAELIALFRINTHFCVLIDSDKKSSHSGLSSTKHRIVDECVQSGAMSWVTWGATIENYIPEDVLVASIKKCYPDKKWEHPLGDRFICPVHFTFKGKTNQPSKIKIARTACRFGFSPLSDAMKKVDELWI
ncbi:MAG: AAA family ATPase [Collinsella sp.]|nr:AAA family ATPase [Collinsella sp.]